MDEFLMSKFEADDYMPEDYDSEIDEEDQSLDTIENYLDESFDEKIEVLTDEEIEKIEAELNEAEDNDLEIEELPDDEIIPLEDSSDNYVGSNEDFEALVEEENPEFYESGEFYTQGINEYGFSGTCGPTSGANCLNVLLGTNEFTENNMLDRAVENNLCTSDDVEPSANGGTTTEQMEELYNTIALEHPEYGLNTEVHEFQDAMSIDEMVDRLDEGSVLQVAVDASALWGAPYSEENNALLNEYGVVRSDHWISITDVDRVDGEVAGFKVIDSGGGVNYLSAEKLEEVCLGVEGRKVYDPTCIVVSKDAA